MFNWNLPFSILVVLSHGIARASSATASIADYPYHVSIEYNDQHTCSGALVNERWILTSAACVYRNGLTDLTVRVATDVPSTGGDQVEIRSIVIHEDFDSISYDNDIALLKLLYPVEYWNGKLPIILPPATEDIAEGTVAILTGWTMDAGTAADQLTVVSTPVVNQDTCASSLPIFKELTDGMLCAGYMSSGNEVCQGDLGAPLVYDDQLYGILTYGLGCTVATYPAVYTRIYSYLPWILSYTGILI